MLISIIVLLLVFALIFWLLDQITSPSSAIFVKWAKIILVIIAVLYLLGLLTGQVHTANCVSSTALSIC